jgi:excisionase family DNA binding protein
MRNELPRTRPIAVSPAEAARLAGIGRTRLYAELGSGALPSFRIGTRRLIRLVDLERWVEGHPVSPDRKGQRADAD